MQDFKNITAVELQTMLSAGDVHLIDVRTDAEVARGYIPGAIKLPLHLLPMKLHEMERGAAMVFYCQMGGRSAQAAAFASMQGYSNVFNLQGGILAWASSGQPLTA
jgi:rhodanese-related sulfurtransferase